MKRILLASLALMLIVITGNHVYKGAIASPTLTQAERSINQIGAIYTNFDTVAATGDVALSQPTESSSTTHAAQAAKSLLRAGLMLDVSLFMLLVASPILLFSRLIQY